ADAKAGRLAVEAAARRQHPGIELEPTHQCSVDSDREIHAGLLMNGIVSRACRHYFFPADRTRAVPWRRAEPELMDELTRAVLERVDRRELIDLASALIRIPSFKTEETPAARFLEVFCRERGYEGAPQEIEPGRLQAIATLPGTGGGASLMLNGHTDINALTRRWGRRPRTPVLEGDRLYGPGVQNMKGGLASIVMAAEAI